MKPGIMYPRFDFWKLLAIVLIAVLAIRSLAPRVSRTELAELQKRLLVLEGHILKEEDK